MTQKQGFSSLDDIKNTCTLIAVREMCRKPDHEVQEAFLKLGWVVGEGVEVSKYYAAAQVLGLELGPIIGAAITIKEFQERYPDGDYIVATRKHCFCIRQGQLIDNLANRRRTGQIVTYFKVKNAKSDTKRPERLVFARVPEKTVNTRRQASRLEAFQRLQHHIDFEAYAGTMEESRRIYDRLPTRARLMAVTGWTELRLEKEIAKGWIRIVD